MTRAMHFLLLLLLFWQCRPQEQSVRKPESRADNQEAPTENNSVQKPDWLDWEAWEVFQAIKVNGQAPDGYVGGRVFQNREKRLPKSDENGRKIKYREWDVRPKTKGKNRGTLRLVTGDDGSAWYTDDHYRTFKQIE